MYDRQCHTAHAGVEQIGGSYTVPVKQSDHLQTICDSEGRLRVLTQVIQSDDTTDAAEVGPRTEDAKVRAPLRSDQEGAICPACKHLMTNKTHVHLKLIADISTFDREHVVHCFRDCSTGGSGHHLPKKLQVDKGTAGQISAAELCDG